MTVYLPKRCRVWYYDFWLKGQRHFGPTGQITKEDAGDFERQKMRELRREAVGLPPHDTQPATDSPRFTDWAAVTYEFAKKRKKLKRPEQFKINLRMVLGFWGARPREHALDNAPYHDRRLIDPIRSPELIEQFEQWMDARGISGPRKNHYRSACSQMYRVACLPQFRKRSGLTADSNPFKGIPRDRVPKRLATLTHEQFRDIVDGAAPHIQIALAIGALAPKLRLNNVLCLRWDQHIARDRLSITVPDHKTDKETGLPLFVPVSPQLKDVLDKAWKKRRGPYVVNYFGRPISDIKTGLKRAVEVSGLEFGRSGITYHSLRHTMATEFARMGLPEALRARLMGHSDIKTTQTYTHMVAADEVSPLAELGNRMSIADLIGASGQAAGQRKKNRKNSKQERTKRKTVFGRRRSVNR